MMKPMYFTMPALAALLARGACHGTPVEPVPDEDVRSIPPDARPSPLGLSRVVLAIPRGDAIGSTSPRGFGILCRGPYGTVARSAIAGHMEKPAMREAFYDTMASQGYDVTGSPSL